MGRVYAGNARGVDRLDPATGRVQHYTTRDGLLSGFVNVALRDREGVLWFGSSKGISRLTPESDERLDPPQVFIGGVRAAGTPHVISHLGQRDVGGLALRPGEGQLQIDFFGLAFGLGESLRYQYRLDGADDRDRWSDLTAERTVHYSRLPPRTYRFQVRAVRADGTLSARAATVAFEVMPALWQRAWFQALVAIAIALAAYAAYRIRLERLLALERVRSRIAGDLHDDIGATLAQIAVLSEVVQTQIDDQHAPLRAPVARIAQTAREAIASMSDIVWAINPQKDSLHEMVRRMRRFANESAAGARHHVHHRSTGSGRAARRGRTPSHLSDLQRGDQQRAASCRSRRSGDRAAHGPPEAAPRNHRQMDAATSPRQQAGRTGRGIWTVTA